MAQTAIPAGSSAFESFASSQVHDAAWVDVENASRQGQHEQDARGGTSRAGVYQRQARQRDDAVPLLYKVPWGAR